MDIGIFATFEHGTAKDLLGVGPRDPQQGEEFLRVFPRLGMRPSMAGTSKSFFDPRGK